MRTRDIPFPHARRQWRRAWGNGMRYLATRVSLANLFTIQASWMGSQEQFKTFEQEQMVRTLGVKREKPTA